MSGVLAGAVLAVVTAAIVLILVLTARQRKGSRTSTTIVPAVDAPQTDPVGSSGAAPPAAPGRHGPCPVCGALLAPGERVRSIVRLAPTHERVMEIYGCPRCMPPGSRRRWCPVCRADLGPQDFLKARVFDRSRDSAKPHVQVRGCSQCRP